MGGQFSFRILMWSLFLAGAGLRLLFFIQTPPQRGFDDHFKPVFLIIRDKVIPAKDACWECYQPPVFYVTAAQVGNVLSACRAGKDLFFKSLQFLPCLFGIATLGMIALILDRFRLSRFARAIAFGFVCFLPRHIYMGAVFSNDTISYLFAAVSVYLALTAIDRGLPPARLAILSIILAITIFTKSTALALLPAVTVGLVVASAGGGPGIAGRLTRSLLLALLLPAVLLGYSVFRDVKEYGKPFPLNVELLDTRLEQKPGEGKVSFVSFKPWTLINRPILAPENLESFWTLIHGRMWFDMEPEFINCLKGSDRGWWKRFWRYLNYRSVDDWPGLGGLPGILRLLGSVLIMLGLFPLAVFWVGVFSVFRRDRPDRGGRGEKELPGVLLLLVLIICNLSGVVIHASRYPVYSFMKAAFILNSLPAFSVFIGKGAQLLARNRSLKWAVAGLFTLLFSLAVLLNLYIAALL